MEKRPAMNNRLSIITSIGRFLLRSFSLISKGLVFIPQPQKPLQAGSEFLPRLKSQMLCYFNASDHAALAASRVSWLAGK